MSRLFEGGGEVGALMREKDWSSTSLGPPEQWPQSLRTVVRIVLTSRYAMWLGWGPDLAFLYNDAYAHMTLGAKHPWALGRPTSEVWAEIWPQLTPRLEKVLSTGEATWDEGLLLFLERNGYPEETYHTFSYSPLPDDAGNVAGNFCVVTEETERVIGERRLASLRILAAGLASASTRREVFAGAELSVAEEPRDLPFAMIYAFEEGGTQARLVACAGIQDTHPAATPFVDVGAPGAIWPFAEIVAGAGIITVELDPGATPPFPSGPWDKAPARALAVPIAPQGHGHPTAVFIAGLNPYRPLDDTYRSFISLFVGQIAAGLASALRYEEERERAEALSAIDRAKTAFFSNVSHEFRTPLTLMLAPTEDALSGSGVMRREELETVYRNQLRLLKLVNSLLEFSRIEAGRTQATYEPTDLAALTIDLASTFRSAIERGGLRFDVDCPPLPEPAFVDRQMWEKIVLNLLSNAFKFTFEGRIHVALRAVDGHSVLTVEDTGVGIAEAERSRVFDRFHRIEGSRARTHEGSGIGLALVQDLVRLHGGTIEVTSRLDHGTTFTVRLPLGSEHLDPERIGSPAALPGTAAGSQAFIAEAERWLGGPVTADEELPPAGPSGAVPDLRARIVLADDNADMRQYVKRLLGTRWAVEAVRNGREALDAVRRKRADLVITDVMMPELDGFGLLSALRGDEATRDIPVLMLSARAGEEMRLEGLQAGADDYLVKPFSARELMARVEMQLLRAGMRAVEDLQRRQLADVFRQAPAAIAIMRGPAHVFDLANPSYLALIANRDVVGTPVREALPELAGQGIFELLDRVYETGEPHLGKAVRLMVTRQPGLPPEECFFDFVYQPMRDAAGAVDGISVVVFEVSDLARARREAEVANRTKDEFLAMLGHELRNPLAPILTALQLMRLRGGVTVEQERTIIERQTQHLVRLVDDLLDVSRIARGKIDLRKERVELAEIVAKAIEMASPLLEERQHDLHVAVPRGLVIEADPARLSQVVANLLTNSAKYTESGGRVRVAAERDGEEVVLRVSDSGIGIAPDMLPYVFEMFAQERQALDRTQGGLGLGLTIVRNLTELHGGSVRAHSDGRGQGSEFVIRLPAAGPGPSAARDEGPARTRLIPAGHPDGVTVLIVDDNQDAAEMLSEYVGSLGYRVWTAFDGPSALRVALETAPAIALLDIGLPVMDGFELAGRLREMPGSDGLKLVAITGYGQASDRERSRSAGFDAHLVKPVDMDALEDLLRLLSVRPNQREA